MKVCALLALFFLMPLSMQASAEKVTIDHGGTTLNANLEKAGSWEKGPVILMTHGTLAHSGMEIMAALQSLFAENDISSLAINLSLGQNDRAQAMYDCPTPHQHRHTDALDEIGAWAEWLGEQGVNSIVLLGHSRGGNQTAWFAAERNNPLVIKVILVAPATWSFDQTVSEYKKRYQKSLTPILETAHTMVRNGNGSLPIRNLGFIYCENTSATADAIASYYADDPRMDTPTLLPRVPKPVLVIAGSEDTVVEGLIEAVTPLADTGTVKLAVVDGADHFFLDLYAEEVADLSLEFIGNE